MNTDPCTQLGHVVKGYTQIADNLRKLKDAYIAQEKAFRKSAAAKRYRLKMIAASLKGKCKNFEIAIESEEKLYYPVTEVL